MLYPSPEFVEAGKFKLLRAILKEKGSQDYATYYANKVQLENQESHIHAINFGALAMVSGIKAE